MRTITTTLKKNLEAQQLEAETLGLTKVASGIDQVLKDQPVRNSEEKYSYAAVELHEDIEFLFNKAALRVQDYYNKALNQKDVATLVSKFSDEFIAMFSPRDPVLGPYEPKVPGEAKEITEIEVEE